MDEITRGTTFIAIVSILFITLGWSLASGRTFLGTIVLGIIVVLSVAWAAYNLLSFRA